VVIPHNPTTDPKKNLTYLTPNLHQIYDDANISLLHYHWREFFLFNHFAHEFGKKAVASATQQLAAF
jgi:hypothetical protein